MQTVNRNTPSAAPSFRIRTYGRTELAQLYSPDITPGRAWRKLKEWLARAPRLVRRLRSLGYDGHQRTFTPKQVQAIVGHLGEP